MPSSWYGYSKNEFLHSGAVGIGSIAPKVPLRDKPTESKFDPIEQEWEPSGKSLARMAIDVDNYSGHQPTSTVSAEVVDGLGIVADLIVIPKNDTELLAEKRCAVSYILAKEFGLLDSPNEFWSSRMFVHEAAQRTLKTPMDPNQLSFLPEPTVKDSAIIHFAGVINEVAQQEQAAQK